MPDPRGARQPRAGLHELTSGENRLVIAEATGRVARLTCGARELIAGDGNRGPLRLHAPLPDYEAHTIDAGASRPEVQASANELVLRYRRLAGKRGPLDIEAEIRIRAGGDGGFEWDCRIHNRSELDIPQVFFPWLSGFGRVDGIDDQVTFGKSAFKPWQTWKALADHEEPKFMRHAGRPSFEMLCSYAYRAGMKWMDLGGASAGASLFSRAKNVKSEFMLVSADGYGTETIDLAWYGYPFIRPGETWQSAVFVLYPHAGDWRQGVFRFKEHADHAFAPAPSTPARDETIGQQTLWMSWHYQDWQDVRHTFNDIPAIAAEARQAGFREMTLARATALDFRLPHMLRTPLGSDAELKQAVADARDLGVNVIPFTTCRLIRPDTIPADQDKDEWFVQNVAGQTLADNWSYDPTLIPTLPVRQIGSRAATYACSGSRGWRDAFLDYVNQMSERWGFRGFMFDQSLISPYSIVGLCFNPRHAHRPDEEGECLVAALTEARQNLRARFGDEAVLSGEAQWDMATEWMDFTWDWTDFEEEQMAPFHMAFPRARQCIKCASRRPLINRVFTAGYWIDLYLEDGQGRLRDYPQLSDYLRTLAAFKQRFLPFLSQRDAYLHDMHVQAAPAQGAWIRTHRHGSEALTLVAQQDGLPATLTVTLDLRAIVGAGERRVTLWSRTLEQSQSLAARDTVTLDLTVPAEDFVAIHVA